MDRFKEEHIIDPKPGKPETYADDAPRLTPGALHEDTIAFWRHELDRAFAAIGKPRASAAELWVFVKMDPTKLCVLGLLRGHRAPGRYSVHYEYEQT